MQKICGTGKMWAFFISRIRIRDPDPDPLGNIRIRIWIRILQKGTDPQPWTGTYQSYRTYGYATFLLNRYVPVGTYLRYLVR